MSSSKTNSRFQEQAEVSPEQALKYLYGDGNPLILVWSAVSIAAMADDLVDLVMLFAWGRHLPANMPSVPIVSEWLPMYRNHRQMMDGLADVDELSDDEECDISLSQLAQHYRAFEKFSYKRRKRLM